MNSSIQHSGEDSLCLQRRKRGKGFTYLDEDGQKLTSKKTLNRIKKLVIPPMWIDVTICKFENGHIQATGRDLKGRKQYIYHTEWERLRQEEKFSRMATFGKKLPKLRKQVAKDLRKRRWVREKVLALMVEILDETGIRIGNKVYEKTNQTYGLSTLRKKHLQISGEKLLLKYKGKSNKEREVSIEDDILAKHIKNVSQIPGYELFKYQDENGKSHSLDSHDVQEYVKEIIGSDFSCKDFRTWVGSRLAIELLPAAKELKETHPRKKLEPTLIKLVSEELGNTPAICKGYYVHPLILNKMEAGDIPEKNPFRETKSPTALTAAEKLLLKLLEE
nr:DNA topoisomerase IB [Cytophagales bacterium]